MTVSPLPPPIPPPPLPPPLPRSRSRVPPAPVEIRLVDAGDVATCRRLAVLMLVSAVCHAALFAWFYAWMRAYFHVDRQTTELWMESWGVFFFIFLFTLIMAFVGAVYLGLTTVLLFSCSLGFFFERQLRRLRGWATACVMALPLGLPVGIYASVFLGRVRKRLAQRGVGGEGNELN